MKHFSRTLMPQIEQALFRGKVIIIYGPRQIGKTTLSKDLLKKHGDISGYFNCEEPSVRSALINKDSEQVIAFLGNNQPMVVLDEAQSVPDIGIILKRVIDASPKFQIIVTGSSSFELADKTSEPLTGRKEEFLLSPLSIEETTGYAEATLQKTIEEWLVYGAYPEVVGQTSFREKVHALRNISSSYLYKDVLIHENIKSPELLDKLLLQLAFQIGDEVSYNDLASVIGVDKNTVQRYISLLEKCYVIFRLPPLTRNRPDEIRKLRKIYFYDNGIRNAIISNYNLLERRNDVEALWENFLVSERLKAQRNHDLMIKNYYWRTHRHAEIGWVEEYDGVLHPYEFQWTKKEVNLRSSTEFLYSYQGSPSVTVVSSDNIKEFLEIAPNEV
jgi:predicted AAA+ superfamily ATPase